MKIRVTGVCIEAGRILLLDQDTDGPRSWSLPGGIVEDGETLVEALVREMREETGTLVEIGRLLYVCDHPAANVLHVSFAVTRAGGTLGASLAGADSRPIRDVTFVDLDKLNELGFTERFVQLCHLGFPHAGSYMGLKAAIGL